MKAFLATTMAAALALAVSVPTPVNAQGKELKVGMVLPFSQVFAVYGEAIMEGFTLAYDYLRQTEGGDKGSGFRFFSKYKHLKPDPF